MRGGGKLWYDVKNKYLPEDLVLAARREETDWVHSEGVPPNLGGERSVDAIRKKIQSRLCAREYNTQKQGDIQRALPASQFFSAVSLLEAVKVLVSIMLSVTLSNKGKPLKLKHYDTSRAHFQGTAQRLVYIKLPTEESSEVWRGQSW